MDKHISFFVKTSFLQLREFHHIRSFILKSTAVYKCLYTFHVDYYNSLFMVFQSILFTAYKKFTNAFIHSTLIIIIAFLWSSKVFSSLLTKSTKLCCCLHCYTYLSFVTYYSNSQTFLLVTY